MFLYVDPTEGQTNEGAAPIQTVTLGTSPETGTVDVGCIAAKMEISIRFGDEISQTAVIPFLEPPGALLSGGDFLANGSVFPTLTGVPFDPSAVEQLCKRV